MLILLSVWRFRGDKTNEKDFKEERSKNQNR